MSVHEQFAEDLALYALGSLEAGERATLEAHLQDCASCRRELEYFRGDAALLALTASGARPPARARTRLVGAIAMEPGTRSAKPRARWWPALGWATAAALMLASAILWRQNTRLKSDVAESAALSERQRSELDRARQSAALSEQQRSELDRARQVVETLTARDAMRVSVLPVGLKNPPPEGKAIYSRARNGLIFMASNFRPLPARKVYELWLIPTHGNPIPAGVFKPDARGSGVVVNPPLPAGVDAKAFAITIEPEKGSKTPTLPILMMGAGG